MRIRYFGLLFSCIISLKVSAQSDSISRYKPRYFNNILAGALLAEEGNGTSLTVSTTHGIRLNRFTVGIGVEYNPYPVWKVLPIFTALSYDIASLDNSAIYINVAGGFAKAWYPEWATTWDRYDSGDGHAFSTGLGYRLKSNAWSLYFSADYKFQRVNYAVRAPWSPPSTSYTVEQDIERVSVQIGFGWH